MNITTNQQAIADKLIKAKGILSALRYAKETLRVQSINGDANAIANWKTIVEYMEAN